VPFIVPFSYEFHDSAAGTSVFVSENGPLRAKPESENETKTEQIKGGNRSVVAGDILRTSQTTFALRGREKHVK
jgi:hypothetical protein